MMPPPKSKHFKGHLGVASSGFSQILSLVKLFISHRALAGEPFPDCRHPGLRINLAAFHTHPLRPYIRLTSGLSPTGSSFDFLLKVNLTPHNNWGNLMQKYF